jgi:hypothetical protein
MAGTTTRSAQRAADEVGRSPVFRGIARGGYAAVGLLHVIIGVIAISIGIHAGGGEADQTGALRSLAQAPGGIVLLWIMVVALVALVVWQIGRGVAADGDAKDRWKVRASAWGQAVGYAVIAVLGVTVAVGGGGGGGGGGQQTLTAQLLAVPAGVVLIVAVGLGIVGGGVWFGAKGIRRKFLDDLVPPRAAVRRAVVVTGMVGHLAKGVSLAVLGILLIVAAVTADPGQAGGLDQAFQALASAPFGEVLVVLTGIGFIAYGVYSGFRARFARL